MRAELNESAACRQGFHCVLPVLYLFHVSAGQMFCTSLPECFHLSMYCSCACMGKKATPGHILLEHIKTGQAYYAVVWA